MEELINRAALALEYEDSREVISRLIQNGNTLEDSFLATCAAEVLNKDRNHEASNISSNQIPQAK